jgi:DUF1680 family protein
MRLLSSLNHYIATTNQPGVQIHQYATAEIEVEFQGQPLQIEMETEYPQQGQVTLTIKAVPSVPWALSLRLPTWCRDYTLLLNNDDTEARPDENGYLTLERPWQAGDILSLDLQMEPTFMAPHPRIDALRGCVALERGPLVYCFESHDQLEGVDLEDVQLLTEKAMDVTAVSVPTECIAIQVAGHMHSPAWKDSLYYPLDDRPQTETQSVQLSAIPYFLWGNRGMESMRIWVPQARDGGVE